MVESAADLIFKALTNAIASGQRIEIRGFGSFTTKEVPAHVARNPSTGERVLVPVKYKVVFKPSVLFRDYYLKLKQNE